MSAELSTAILPANYIARPPRLEDAPEVAKMINICEEFFNEQPTMSADELSGYWSNPHHEVSKDFRVILAPDGKIVAYGECVDERKNGRVYGEGYVHPDHMGRGLGTYIVKFTESRGWEYAESYPDGVRVSIICATNGSDEAAQQLFTGQGFSLVRVYYRMEIDMDELPPAPEWPEGITVRTVIRGQDERAVHTTITEAFKDHWGSTPITYEHWYETRVERGNYDPSMWYLAVDTASGEVAGVSICSIRNETVAWLNTLAVRRPWRKRGLGFALLRHTFREFYQRGFHNVGLGVDGQNLTGATRLYERAGMHIAQRYTTYEKELRPGKALYTTELNG